MADIILTVEGMTCSGCANSVTNVLNAVPGVEKTEVSLADNSAAVRYNPDQTTPETLIEAVEDAGYDASVR